MIQPQATVELTTSTYTMALVGEDVLQPSSDSFWEVDGYRRTVKRVEDGSMQCSELMKMVQERADIERDYAKRLKMWAKKWNESFDRGDNFVVLM